MFASHNYFLFPTPWYRISNRHSSQLSALLYRNTSIIIIIIIPTMRFLPLASLLAIFFDRRIARYDVVSAADVSVVTSRGVYVGSDSDPRFNDNRDGAAAADDAVVVESFLGMKYANVPRRFARSRLVGGRDCPAPPSAFEDEDEDEDEDKDAFDPPPLLLLGSEDPSTPARFARRSRLLGGSSPPPPSSTSSTVLVDATEFGPYCWQGGTNGVRRQYHDQSEECLYLNIWRASGTTRVSNLPVMVFVHGGGWSDMGSADMPFWGHRIVSSDPDVLVVSINYRLGIFGFLATDDSGSGGMNGLDDMVNALRWIRCHVGNFGGDPNRVTLFGQGVGSASVCYLAVMNPGATGLFHRGILQSGECVVGDDRPDSIGLVSGEEGYAIALDVLDDLNATTFEELADRDLYPAEEIAQVLPAVYPVLDRRILPDFPS